MTKQISWTVWSQTDRPGGPAQVVERKNVEVITSCCAGLESSQKGNCGHTGGLYLVQSPLR